MEGSLKGAQRKIGDVDFMVFALSGEQEMLQVIGWFRWWGCTSRNTVFLEWLWRAENRVFLHGVLVGWDRRWFLIRMSRNTSQENTRKTRIKSRFFPPRPIENDKGNTSKKHSENYIFSPTFDPPPDGVNRHGGKAKNKNYSQNQLHLKLFSHFCEKSNTYKNVKNYFQKC